MDLKGKKVLLVGLGILGGGLSMAKFFLSKGAILRITDLRDENALRDPVSKLPDNIEYTLGKHEKSDFEWADLIIFNQAVPAESEWIKLAVELNKKYYNDYIFFLENLKTVNPDALIIGVTGTRGKTTVSTWIHNLIPRSVLAGNIPEKNFLRQIGKKTEVFVLELSSYQLEHMDTNTPSPQIAVLTNVYVDHLNRYGGFDKYRDIKFNIFKNQTEKDALILNTDEPITKKVLAEKPRAQLFFISQRPLSKSQNGLYFDGEKIIYQFDGKKSIATTVKNLAPHEKANLLSAMLAAHLAGVEGKEISGRIRTLPMPILRQQVVLKNKNFTVVNDSAGTSPDATIAAIEKFKDEKNFVLIAGGTNKELEFGALAKKIAKDVEPENLYLLSGSATDLLTRELTTVLDSRIVAYESLEEILDVVSQKYDNATIVFSPGAASFEKFKNEFDRGAKFNKLVRKYFG